MQLAPEAFDLVVDELIKAKALRVLHHLAAHEDELTAVKKKLLSQKSRAIDKLVKRVVEALI